MPKPNKHIDKKENSKANFKKKKGQPYSWKWSFAGGAVLKNLPDWRKRKRHGFDP